MIAAALRAEADEYVERFSDELDEDGHRLVVRNGRKVTIGSGTIPVRTPRVNDERSDEEGERQKFSSRILPAYARRSPKVGEVIPILYLRGLSTGDFRPALEGLLGEDAAGLSASTVSRMCKEWEEHHARFRQQLLSFTARAAPRDVFPSSGEQRCWFHASGNVIDALPKRCNPARRDS